MVIVGICILTIIRSLAKNRRRLLHRYARSDGSVKTFCSFHPKVPYCELIDIIVAATVKASEGISVNAPVD